MELQMTVKIQKVSIADIIVPRRHRPIVHENVRSLADSMSKIGLKTPPTVVRTKKGLVLVTGRHRLEAAKLLGWKHLRCVLMKGDKADRSLWRIAENFHRADLTKLERAELLKEWEQLIQEKEGVKAGGNQPNDKGISKAAKALGISREKVRRSRRIEAISPEARRLAEAAGLDDNQQALLKIAKQATPKAQAKMVRKLAKNGRTKGRSALSPEEVAQYEALKLRFKANSKFRRLWDKATTAVRQKFINSVLKPSA
jgi:ParB-like chromosome segregation protein Spo0J